MKIKREAVPHNQGASFHLLVTPHLTDSFMWHYHPEYEIVYIDGASGTRHVGDHISPYTNSDLVFIGPNVPHLNFDYGVKTAYQEIVIQLKEDFLGSQFLNAPEFADIVRLFEQARQGIAFHGKAKQLVGDKLTCFPTLPPFRQLMELLEIFQLLATTTEFTLLNSRPADCQYNLREQQRIRQLYQFIEDNHARPILIDEVAGLTSLTRAAFCRYVRKMTQMTFTELVNQYRVNQAQKLLLANTTVTDTCFQSGFESLSYFNRVFQKVAGSSPTQFKKQHGR